MLKGFKTWVFYGAALLYFLLIMESWSINFAIDDGRTVSQTAFFMSDCFLFLGIPAG